MKISDVTKEGQITQLIQQAGKPNPPEKGSTEPGSKPRTGEDRVNLSPEARELQRIHDLLEATPSVRTEKVQAVREAVESGQYQVKNEDLADKMIKDALLEFLK